MTDFNSDYTGVQHNTAIANVITYLAPYTSPDRMQWLADVTSSIQGQLNDKAPIASPTFTGSVTMPSIIGILGLAGVVINDGIIMLDFLHGTHKPEEFFKRAKLRLRPIIITSVTTFLGLFTLIFYASGQAVILQPIAISIGFGLLWGTVLNLIYLPTLYALVNGITPLDKHQIQSTPK